MTDLLQDSVTRRLRSDADWRWLLEQSRKEPVLVLKHSRTCDISAYAMEDLLRFLSARGSITCGVVHVVEDRELSNAIADETGIRHESPQLIVLKDDKAIWHASHRSIDLGQVEQMLNVS